MITLAFARRRIRRCELPSNGCSVVVFSILENSQQGRIELTGHHWSPVSRSHVAQPYQRPRPALGPRQRSLCICSFRPKSVGERCGGGLPYRCHTNGCPTASLSSSRNGAVRRLEYCSTRINRYARRQAGSTAEEDEEQTAQLPHMLIRTAKVRRTPASSFLRHFSTGRAAKKQPPQRPDWTSPEPCRPDLRPFAPISDVKQGPQSH